MSSAEWSRVSFDFFDGVEKLQVCLHDYSFPNFSIAVEKTKYASLP